MCFILLSTSNSKQDDTFAKLHELAANIELGSPSGRIYLTLFNNSLEFSQKKSDEVSQKSLDKFMKKKLRWLPEENARVVRIDLSIIKRAQDNSQKFEMASDIFISMMDFLEGTDILCNCALVNKRWHQQISQNTKLINKLIEATPRGPEKWKSLFNVNVDVAPKISKDYFSGLKNPSPFFSTKRKIDTHFHTYFIPKTLDPGTPKERPMTANNLLELIKNKVERLSFWEGVLDKYLENYGNTPIEKASWVEMTKIPVPLAPGSGQDYLAHETLITSEPGYYIPKVLPAMICFVFEYAMAIKAGKDKKYLNKLWFYTFCQELAWNRQITICLRFSKLNLYTVGDKTAAMRTILIEAEKVEPLPQPEMNEG